MRVRHVGDRVVQAETKGFKITTDVPSEPGGDVTAPSPGDLLLAALGNCTFYYVLHFCRQHDVPLDDVWLSVDVDRNEETHRMEKIRMDIHLPEGTPDSHLNAVVRAAAQCTIKKYLQDCPEIETTASKA